MNLINVLGIDLNNTKSYDHIRDIESLAYFVLMTLDKGKVVKVKNKRLSFIKVEDRKVTIVYGTQNVYFGFMYVNKQHVSYYHHDANLYGVLIKDVMDELKRVNSDVYNHVNRINSNLLKDCLNI